MATKTTARKTTAAARKPAKKTTPRVPETVNGTHDPAAAAALAIKKPKNAPKTSKPKKPTKPKHPKAVITFRHNFVPPLLGILMFAGVLGILNGQWLVAQYEYRFKAQAVAASIPASAPADPNAPARIHIPKINVSAPIVTDQKTYDPSAVQLALQRGTVQYGSSADPGQKGNIVVIGHSSGQLWSPGDYKFVFTMLDKLTKDDRIFVDFKGQRYIFRVESTNIVPPTELSVLQHTKQPRLTLITCTPVGTNRDRLIIVARQVSPNPETATEIDRSRTIPVTTRYIPN